MTRWRARHRGTRSDRGAAAVEFAIVLIVLLLIIFAIIDFGRLLFVTQAARAASREGARVAVVATGDGQKVFDAANNAVGAASALGAGGGVTITASPGGTMPGVGNPVVVVPHATLCPSAGGAVRVQVNVKFRWLTPIGVLPGLANSGLTGVRDVAADTTMRCE